MSMKAPDEFYDFIRPRKVPTPDESYFSDLASMVSSQEQIKTVPLYRKYTIWVSSMAASILVTLFLYGLFHTDPSVQHQLPNPDKGEILAYIKDNIDDFDLELIAEALPDTLLAIPAQIQNVSEDLSNSSSLEDLKDLKTDEIEEYLDLYNIDPDETDENVFI